MKGQSLADVRAVLSLGFGFPVLMYRPFSVRPFIHYCHRRYRVDIAVLSGVRRHFLSFIICSVSY